MPNLVAPGVENISSSGTKTHFEKFLRELLKNSIHF